MFLSSSSKVNTTIRLSLDPPIPWSKSVGLPAGRNTGIVGSTLAEDPWTKTQVRSKKKEVRSSYREFVP